MGTRSLRSICQKIDPALLRLLTASPGPYRQGTIVVNVGERRLYLVRPGGAAIRYAVGVGREEALNFRGSAVIGRKAEWPRWSPTEDMIRRMPIYAHYAGGLSGGINNPLGARALYLYRGNQDTYFRLHDVAIDRHVHRRRFRVLVGGKTDRGPQSQVRRDGRVAVRRRRHHLGQMFERVGIGLGGDGAFVSSAFLRPALAGLGWPLAKLIVLL